MGGIARELCARWKGEADRLQAIGEDIRAGKDWTRHLLAVPGRWKALRYLETCPKRALGSEAAARDLRGVVLEDWDFSGAEGLADAALDFATLRGVNLRGASLRGSSLRFARIEGGCVVDEARLEFADLAGAVLQGSSVRSVVFRDVDLTGASFKECDLAEAVFVSSTFSRGGLLRRVFRGQRRTRFENSLQGTDCWGEGSDRTIQRWAQVEISRRRWKKNNPLLGRLDMVLTDHGRSPGRLLGWTAWAWLSFGVIYAGYDLPPLLQGTRLGEVLVRARPVFSSSSDPSLSLTGFEPYYLSAVTLTGFGHSNVFPSEDHEISQVLVLAEIGLGYVLLAAFVALVVQNLWAEGLDD